MAVFWPLRLTVPLAPTLPPLSVCDEPKPRLESKLSTVLPPRMFTLLQPNAVAKMPLLNSEPPTIVLTPPPASETYCCDPLVPSSLLVIVKAASSAPVSTGANSTVTVQELLG